VSIYPHFLSHQAVAANAGVTLAIGEKAIEILARPAAGDPHAAPPARGLVVHSLRHFFETHCVNAGVPQMVVNEWMGHRDGPSMSRVYYELSSDAAQSWISKVPFGDPGHVPPRS